MTITKAARPTIKFYYSDQLKDELILQQILYGAEEEGIPVEMQKVPEANVLELAHKASKDSVLGTGIGVSSSYAAVHYEKLPVDRPVYLVRLNAGDEAVRRVGVNGARLVKRMPLKIK
ncbi:MAG: glycerol dehydratase reactivase beta/small subunit family protein [Lachnospiraceae bacterium]|nr:glycerol dehydratase reactivase beta/small subunit family protein [Lachnospiraceae bacterium]